MTDPLDLSREQAAAARAPMGDLCVLAGAGSGKTRVLTARFVEHVLTHKVPVRQVGALTFTERAAREMRRRVGEAFLQVGHPELAEASDDAPISTLHAFCARVLRRNAVAAGLDPSFEVLDQDAALLLEAEALERAQERLRVHPDAPRLRRALGRLVTQDALATLLALRHDVCAAGGDVARLTWRDGGLALPAARASAAQALDDLEVALDAWPGAPDGADASLVLARRALAAGDPVAADPAAAAEALESLALGGKGSQPSKTARRVALEACAAWTARLLDEEGGRDVLPHVVTILGEVERAYVGLKVRRAALDFLDLEREAVRLLEARRGFDVGVEGLPRAVLVDEHQDTNPLQERILAALRLQGVTQFSVGDPKQSIYRFRGADVRVLLGEEQRVGARGRRTLADSYRATPEVVAALGGLFERLFAGGAAGVPFAPLNPAGSFGPATAGAPPAVTLACWDRRGRSADAGRHDEARAIVAWLQDLVGRRVLRRHAKHPRPLGWGDCAILVRATAAMRPLERALSAAGIPLRVHRGRGLLEAEEIESLVMALRVVHDAADRFAWGAFLRGPAVAASDGDLLAWFAPDVDPRAALEADERPRVRAVLATLADLRRLARRADLPRLVEATVERLGLLAAALAQPDGARRAANLRRAAGLAEDLAAAGRHDLPSFLRHLELLDALSVQQAEAPALGDDGEAVTLLTVHAAKGLEWPVVVLADLARKPPPRGEPYLLEGNGRVALRLKHELEGEVLRPAGLLELDALDGAADEQETRRLLYVALTRAEQHLLVTATHDGVTKDGLVAGSGPWSRELLAALGETPAPGVREVAVGSGCVTLRAEALADVLAAADRGAPPPRMPAAQDEAAEVEAAFERARPWPAPLGGTRYVASVSELLLFARSPAAFQRRRLLPEDVVQVQRESEREQEREPEQGPSVREPDEPDVESPGLDRAALGTAVHAALEAWRPDADPFAALETALRESFPGGVPTAARALGRSMLERFAASGVARDLGAALVAGQDLRREAAFHARIRFPEGATVAGFQHLLVRGTFDLWLPRAGGIQVVDHKTNPPTAAHPTPESLAAHYAPQLLLYALAAERLLGRDVAGASLLLLDPGWGPEAVEVPIAIDGEALEEARRMCQAFATAERDDRWPETWADLLPR